MNKFSFAQPGLVLAQSVITEGIYPVYDAGSHWGGTADILGLVVTTAYNPSGISPELTPAQGQTLSPGSSINDALLALLGTRYGGVYTAFNLPDLSGAAIVDLGMSAQGSYQGAVSNSLELTQAQLPGTLGGASDPFSNAQYAQGLQYLIQVNGLFPTQDSQITTGTLGAIYPFAGNQVPIGFMRCEGQTLPISQYQGLFSILGTTYGGDGTATFALPNLVGILPIVAGDQYQLGEPIGDSQTSLQPWNVPNAPKATTGTTPVTTLQPSLAVNAIINVQGEWGDLTEQGSMLGQVTLYAGEYVPEGWFRCEGQLLSVDEYSTLFQLIGTQFGGDGVVSFALPDLRNRTIIGSGNELAIGTQLGQVINAVSINNLPDITVSIPGVVLTNDTGASGTDQITKDFDLTVSGLWPGAQIQYSADGATWASSYQAHEGVNQLWVRQVDVLGQTSAASQPLSFTLDTGAPITPTVTLDYGVALRSIAALTSDTVPETNTGALSIEPFEPGALIHYSTDGGATWSAHFAAVAGLNQVQVRLIDRAGNASEASDPLRFNLTSDPDQAALTESVANAEGGVDIHVQTPGTLSDSLGTDKVDTVHFGLAHDLRLPTTVENAILSGLGYSSLVVGNTAANHFDVRSGNWLIHGDDAATTSTSGKSDTMQLSGRMTDYLISQTTLDGQRLVTLIGPDTQVQASGIEHFEFADGTLHQTTDQAVADLYALYQAAFDRAPDFNGLNYWLNLLHSGTRLEKVTEDFVRSNEYIGQHGANISDPNFVTDLYHNLLNRAPDQAGLDYWTEQIQTNAATRGDVIAGFIKSPERMDLATELGLAGASTGLDLGLLLWLAL